MTRSVAMRALAFVSIAAATIQCTDSTAPRVLDNSIGVIVSGLVHPVSLASAPSSTVLPTHAVYVSLSPNAVAAGVAATITNQATGLFVTTPVINGGFDPVPIPANEGDTLAVVITVTPPAAPVRAYVIAASRRPPRIVRSQPPSGGRDVPLNATMVVVFSEPVDPATFDTAALQLFLDTARVLGTVQLAGGANLIAEFQPSSTLAAQTAYQLTVSPQIHGVGGLAVPVTSPIQFTTGTSVQAQAAAKLAFTVQPTNMTAGNVLGPVVVAIQDSLGNTVTSANDAVFMSTSCVPGSNCDSSFTAYALSGGRTVQAINGLATFSTLYLGTAAKGYTLVATSGTLASATSAPFDVSPRAPAQLQFVKLGRATVAQPFTVDVAIEDGSYNKVPSATNAVTLSLASGPAGGTLTGTLTANAVNGLAHFAGLSVDQPGPYTLSAAANALTGATGAITAYTAGAFVAVSAGANHTCGLTIDGVAHCWGLNDHGQLGDGTTTNRTVPVSVAGGLTFSTVVTGGSHTCGHSTTGPWYCWGANASGQLGDGTTSDQWSPVALAGSLQLDGLSAGGSHTCGSVSGRDLEELFYCWGLNDHGQLGDGTTTQRTSPTLVSGIGLAYGPIVAGTNHTCAQNYDTGDSFCWGANNHGQLNDGTTSDRTTAFSFWGIPCGFGPPGFVPPMGCPSGAVTPFNAGIATGGAHTCAAAGGSYYQSFALYCWGANANGQLGDGTTTDRLGPVLVNGGQPFGQVTAGGSHTCAMGNPRQVTSPVYCWGSNTNGQLGDGTLTQRTSPVLVAGGLSFLYVSAGANHTCGVTLSGAYCWGSNATGQLGNGSTTDSNVPIKVAGQ